MERIRIGLVDDHALLRKGIKAMLAEYADFDVVAEASNGEELLQRLSELRDLPDVCLLDIGMPIMDGYSTLIELKKKYAEIQVLILSQHDEELAIIRMLKAGASGFLHKDTDPIELAEAIRVVLKGVYYQNKIVNGRIVSLVRRDTNNSHHILNESELEFLKYVCTELTYKEIADRMQLSRRTVEGYRERLFEKLEVKSRTALAMYALRLGLIPKD